MQFITNYRRVSPHYGGDGGTPTILHSEDGVFVGCSGRLNKDPKGEEEIFSQIQVSVETQNANQLKILFKTIWRHDIVETGRERQNMYFEYFGGDGGQPFNDLPFLEFLDSARISSINIRHSRLIDGIQACVDL